MNAEEKAYLDLLQYILDNGNKKEDRTGIGTLSIFGGQLRFSLEDNKIPILTTKKIFIRGCIEELLFFIRGETNSKKLEDKGINIWKGNTSKEFLKKRGLDYEEGEMGPMYGNQWRSFSHDPQIKGIDQLKNVIQTIRTDPNSRRLLITAYNPLVLHLGVLEPCHTFYQFYVNDNKLSCQFYMRSSDCFLGLPFNILSYAILTHIVAKTVGMTAKEIIFVGGDIHCYLNHLDQAKEQVSRTPYNFPTLNIEKSLSCIEDIEELSFQDFQILNYESHPAIKAPMAI